MIYRLAADALLVLHVGFVLFVVLGLVLIWLGGGLGWSWVRNLSFRIAHLICIGIVVLQAWLGQICPLTIWEMALREKAGDVTYAGSFIQHWLHELLYYEAPMWVFAVCYTVFGLLVMASWYFIRPRRMRGPPRST